jgi:hypothetical protein
VGGGVDDKVVASTKGSIPILLSSHSRTTVLPIPLAFLQYLQRCCHAHQIHRASRQHTKGVLQFELVAKDQVDDQYELRVD